MPKSILIIGNYLPDGQKSMLAYSRILSGILSEVGYDVTVLSPSAVLVSLLSPSSRLKKVFGYLDKFIVFPLILLFAQRRFEQVHVCDHSNSIYGFFLYRRRITITCHDVIAIRAARGLISHWKTPATGKVFQWLIYHGLWRFDEIFCVSKFTERELLELNVGFKTSVAENPLNGHFRCVNDGPPSVLSRLAPEIKDRGYFLHVGSDHKRKNRSFLLEVIAGLRAVGMAADISLVFVGPGPTAEMESRILELGLIGQVFFLSEVNHEQLVELYSSAKALLFPSFNEGFGWPIVEAQACGCPVFASAVEPMPEVGGQGAQYFSPFDPEDCVRQILTADTNTMREQGFRNVERFTVENLLRKMRFI